MKKSSLILSIFLGLALVGQSLGLASSAYAMAPPATSLCIIMPSVCEPTPPTPPAPAVKVEFVSPPARVKVGEEVKYVAKVTGGNPGDTVNYLFYCNRADNGTNILTPYANGWEKKDGAQGEQFTAERPCVYPNAGLYTAKVIAEKSGYSVEARVQIEAYYADPSVSFTADPNPTNAAQNFNSTLTASIDGLLNPSVVAQAPVNEVLVSYDSPTVPASAPEYEVQSGRATLSGEANQFVHFTKKFTGGAPVAVVVNHDYPGSTDNYRVSGITDTGFFFSDSDTRAGRTITWMAVKGEIPGKLKAGRINSGDGNTVRFTAPFTGNADTIGVGFTRSKPVHDLGGDECCVVMDVTNNGFRWGGDATDRSSDYPFYWIAMQGTFTVEGENAPAIMAGKIRQNGNRVGGQLYIDYPAAFANPAVSAVLSKDWSVRDEQMPWVAIPSNPQEAKSRFYRGGDQAEQPGGLCLGRLCVSSPYNNRWIAMDRTYLSPQAVPSKDSLSALFKVSSNRGLSGFKPTFSVSDMGGTARGDVHYQLYCEAGVASTLKEPPRSAHTSHAWNGDCEYVVPAGQMSVTKTAEIIVERGTAEPIKARFDITVYNSKFTLYKDRSDTGTNVTPGGSEVIHPATGSKQFTYDITKPEFTGKVIIEQLGAAPVQRTVTVSVTPGTVDPPPCGSNCPTDNPEPTTPPTTPSPGPTDGENPNYGEGSGSF